MGTISTSIKVSDGMTPALRSMLRTMNMVISGFENMQRLSGSAIDVSSMQVAREELAGVNAAVNQMENDIRQAQEEQERFNQRVSQGKREMGGLGKKALQLAAAYMSVQTAKEALSMSDRLSNTSARLSMIVDVAPGQDTAQAVTEMQEKIFSSASRSRANYLDTADSVAKMSLNAPEAFASNNETIQFVENLNKQFAIAGTEAAAIQSATLQLTQALGSGVLRGEELNAVFEAAPNIIQTIADYMGIGIGEIREMASEGEITAEIVKNAMLSATDSINAQYEAMPVTFAQVWNIFQNHAIQSLQPVWGRLQEIANSQEFMDFAINAADALGIVADAFVSVLEIAVKTGGFIADNWSAIAPFIHVATAALGIYMGYLIAKNTLELIGKGIAIVACLASYAKAAATGAEASATAVATAAQYGFNTALLACPITWIIVLIGILLIAIYKWAQSVGGLKIAWMLCMNAILTRFDYARIGLTAIIYEILNKLDLMKLGFMAVNTGVSNAVGDMRINVLNIMQSMINEAIDLINEFINYVNALPGVSIDTIEHVTFATEAAVKNEVDKQSRMDKLKGTAYETVQNIAGRKENLGAMRAEAEANRRKRVLDIMSEQLKAFSWNNFTHGIDLGLGTTAADISSIAKDTGSISDALEITEEDIKYLRDIAERDVINRFTTAEIKVDMGGVNNNINSSVDLDGFMQSFCSGLEEASAIAAEGVH